MTARVAAIARMGTFVCLIAQLSLRWGQTDVIYLSCFALVVQLTAILQLINM